MRKHYLDNLRSFCVLLLFPYHTCMVYNAVESFFVHYGPLRPFSDFIIFCYPWFMALMFVLAGISSRLSLERRTPKAYVKERFLKLCIPFLFGIAILVPPQTYFAERYHNGYTAGYFSQYKLYFQNFTELTGYAGGFTPAHLWFILYLFLFSLLTLPFFLRSLKKWKDAPETGFARFGMLGLVGVGVIPILSAFIFNISGKSIGEYLALFILGFYLFSQDGVIDLCKKYRWPLTGVSLALLALADYLFQQKSVGLNVFAFLGLKTIMWVSVLAALGLGAKYLNFSNRATRYFAKSSFPVYILHQPILLCVAFYVLETISSPYLQALVIAPVSFVLTFLAYELVRRIPPLRFCLGIKKEQKAPAEKPNQP